MAKRTVSAQMSRDIVQLLLQRGMTLTSLADMLRVSKSYISRVSSGSRNFTLNHLAALERHLGEPLPWLLLDAIDPESIKPELRTLYRSTAKVLEATRRETVRKLHRNAKAA